MGSIPLTLPKKTFKRRLDLPEVICNTSPLQYLHQLKLLHILPALTDSIYVPPAVLQELSEGQKLGVDLPDLTSISWITIRALTRPIALPQITNDLGLGETAVLALALEMPNSIVILDDALGRATAKTLDIPFTGTLGLLLDAKNMSLIIRLTPILDQLQMLGFRLSLPTRKLILDLAKE